MDIRLGTSSTDEWNWNRGALITYFSNQARSAGNAFLDAPDNNGNVTMQEHYVPTDDAISTYSITLRDPYDYDGVNRVTQTNGVQRNTAGSYFSIYGQGYDYDQWGNRTISQLPARTWGTAINILAYTVSSTNNRVNGVTYDAAGNVTSDPNGVSTATYDAENRMKSALKGRFTSVDPENAGAGSKDLIPERPDDACTCPHCQGTGIESFSAMHNIDGVVCYCGGLGWIPNGNAERGAFVDGSEVVWES